MEVRLARGGVDGKPSVKISSGVDHVFGLCKGTGAHLRVARSVSACWARDVRAGCVPVSEGAVAGLAKALKAKRKRLGSRVQGVGGGLVGGGSQIDSNKHLVTSHPHWRVLRNR